MSWHREYVFFIQEKLPLSLELFFASQEQFYSAELVNLPTKVYFEEQEDKGEDSCQLFLDLEEKVELDEKVDLNKENDSDEYSDYKRNFFEITSRSDIFGVIVRSIIQQFTDVTILQFFQERNEQDLELNTDDFENRLVSFDHIQQKQVIAEIDRLFEYTKTQPTIFEEWAAEFSNIDSLEDQLSEAFSMPLHNFDCPYDDQGFVEVMMILKFIKEFFEKSLEQKLYVGYYDYIP